MIKIKSGELGQANTHKGVATREYGGEDIFLA
jgi:hypothetical protein